jgi:hypothetical protein
MAAAITTGAEARMGIVAVQAVAAGVAGIAVIGKDQDVAMSAYMGGVIDAALYSRAT